MYASAPPQLAAACPGRRERRVRLIWTLLLSLLLLPALARPAAAFSREEDPVVISCGLLTRLYGVPIERIRVLADKGGGLEVIPFQIDKVDMEGRYILDAEEEKRLRAARIERFEENRENLSGLALKEAQMAAEHREDMRIMDGNDELAFMAWDLGYRVSKEDFPPGCHCGHEIEVINPLDGTKAYAYVLAFDKPPPYSQVDYVRYDAKTETIDSKACRIGFRKDKPLIISSFYDKDESGRLTSGNVIDRFKSRLTLKPKFFFTLHFDEEGIESRTVAYKDGPVRLIRRNEYWVEVLFLRVTPRVRSDYVFYANQLLSPIEIDLSFDPATFFREGSVFVAGMDHSPAAMGARIYSRDNPEPFVLDGQTSWREQRMNTVNQDWFVIKRDNFGVVAKIELSPELIELGITPDLYYVDDLTVVDAPESYPGSLFLGYSIDLTRFPEGRHFFTLHLYYGPGFHKGDEKKFLNILENPLVVNIK